MQSYIQKGMTVFTSCFAPSDSPWWLFAITFPLTLVALTLNSKKAEKAFSDFGGILVCGTPALTLLVVFYGSVAITVGLVLWKIFSILIRSNSEFSVFWNILLTLLMLTPLMIVFWLLKKVGAVELVREVLGYVAFFAKELWAKRMTIAKNPHWLWSIVGASLIALFINGAFVTNLTSAVLPGLIPGIAAALGVFVLLRRILRRQSAAQ